jgi:hypothetical protein
MGLEERPPNPGLFSKREVTFPARRSGVEGCPPRRQRVRAASIRSSRSFICRNCSAVDVSASDDVWRERDTNVLVIAAVMTVRKPIPSSMTSAARSCPETVVGTSSPYPTVVTVWTAHQSPDPRDGKLARSTTVMRRPAATVIKVDTVAMTTPAPRGVVARARILSSRRSSLVSSAIEMTFALAHSGPAQDPAWFVTLRRNAGVRAASRVATAGDELINRAGQLDRSCKVPVGDSRPPFHAVPSRPAVRRDVSLRICKPDSPV